MISLAHGGHVPSHHVYPADDSIPVQISPPEAWMHQADYDEYKRLGVLNPAVIIHIVPDDEDTNRAQHRDLYGTELDRDQEQQ